MLIVFLVVGLLTDVLGFINLFGHSFLVFFIIQGFTIQYVLPAVIQLM